eukprot:Phypoly_transcript_11384.p1 GENE.Phypoly_transcript_11384~~Phypoly_transcript_11384.p1  ORF type:complete len:371 (+),score=30.18 Phypoly_transcript_11384:51-1115(+)
MTEDIISPTDLYLGVTPKQVPNDVAPKWEADEDVLRCRKCDAKFNVVTRRHHCRGCGKIFCSKDCDAWLLLPQSFGYGWRNVCVCEDCYMKYSLVDYTKSYDEFGSKTAPTIVIISGAMMGRIMPPCILHPLMRKFHVIALDLPGLGARKGEKLTPESANEAIKNVIVARATNKKAIVFGYSMGGHAAMKFGAAHPELCAGLILGGCCNEYPPGMKTDGFFGLVNLVYTISSNKMKAGFLHTVLPKNVKPEDTEWMFATGMDYSMWSDCGNIMREPYTGFYRQALANYTCPTLMIHGDKDYNFAEETFRKAANDNVKFVVIEGADHLIMVTEGANKKLGNEIFRFVDLVYETCP